jgi:hypothetical protein
MPGPESIIERDGSLSSRIDAPFPRAPVVKFLADSRFLVGNTGSDQFALHQPDGAEVASFRADLPVIAVAAADREAFLDSTRLALQNGLARVPQLTNDDRARLRALHRRILDGLQFPRTQQRYLLAELDSADALWLLLPGGRTAREREWRRIDLGSGTVLERIRFSHLGPIIAAATEPDAFYTIELDTADRPYVLKYERRE